MTMLHLQTENVPGGYAGMGTDAADVALFDRLYLWARSPKWAAARLCTLLAGDGFRAGAHRDLLDRVAAEVPQLPTRLLGLTRELMQGRAIALTEDGAELLNDLLYEDYRRMRAAGVFA